MNEIIRLHGRPFHPEPIEHPRRQPISFRRIGTALLLVCCCAGVLALAAWLAFETVFLPTRARMGDPVALYRLGKRALAKSSSPQEQTQALESIQTAADQGSLDAQTTLGYHYAKRNNSPQDLEAAARWFRKAAIQGSLTAQTELGALYASGTGLTRDDRKAFYWYSKAAAAGSQTARANLALARAGGAHPLGDLTTRNGKHYCNVALRNIDSAGIMISYDLGAGGVGLVKLRRDDLPDDLKQLCKSSSRVD